MGLGSLLSGGLDLVSGGLSSALSFAGDRYSQEDTQDFNKRQAELNRRFQERMSNTAFQRAADDLEKAGLNRILAFGNPASTPGGAMAQSGVLPAGSSAISAGSNAMNAVTNSRSADQNIEESKSRQSFIAKNVEKSEYEMDKLFADTKLAYEKSAETRANTTLKELDIPKQEVVRTLYEIALPYAKALKDGDSSLSPEEFSRELWSSINAFVSYGKTMRRIRDDFSSFLGDLFDNIVQRGNRAPTE